MVQKFIIRTDIPFTGNVESFVKMDGLVAFSDLTPEQYLEQSKNPLRIIDETEMDKLMTEFSASLQGSFVEITEEKFVEMESVLPPKRMTSFEGGKFFFISEALFANVHALYAFVGGKYFTTDRSLYMPESDLIAEIKNI